VTSHTEKEEKQIWSKYQLRLREREERSIHVQETRRPIGMKKEIQRKREENKQLGRDRARTGDNIDDK